MLQKGTLLTQVTGLSRYFRSVQIDKDIMSEALRMPRVRYILKINVCH